MQILLIEDSESHAELVRRSLAPLNASLEVVQTLAAAREHLATHVPDVVLSDLQLPDGSSIILLGDYPNGVPWPVIMMTGHGDETLAVSSIKAGALDYVVKSPESIRQMPRLIERAMREWRRMIDHRSTQLALRASEEQLRYAMDATSDGLWDWDLSNGNLYWAPRTYVMLGYAPQEFVVNYDIWRELLHPDEREGVVEELWRQIRGQGVFSLEFRLRTKSGDWRWINGRGKPVSHGIDGHILRIVGTHVDIHERVISEQRLLESKKRFELLFEQARDMIFVVDAASACVLEMNTSAERQLGLSRSVVVGRPLHELVVPEMRSEFEAQFRKIAAGRAGSVELVELSAAEGRRVPTELAASSIVLPSGQVVVQGIFRDVSERLQLEAQLRQAQKMEAIGQLAGGVAHDFNNMLAAIMLQVSMLQGDRRMPPEVHSTLGILETSAKRAADLTRQLLLFGRRQPAKMQPVDLELLVGNLIKMLRRLIGEANILDFHQGAQTQWVNADASMIEQVVMNLVVNARDAMPQGGRIDIRIDSLRMAPPESAGIGNDEREYTRVRVSDTGMGIDEHTRKRLFEPFFTTKPQGKGTGLGLATAYSILKTHQGWIDVESEAGKGACFLVYLPRIPAPLPVVRSLEAVFTPVAQKGAVLLVEDDLLVRTFTTLSLKSAGFSVLEASDGFSALTCWKQSKAVIELVVTDMVMPSGLNGWDLVTAMRKERPALPAVIMSGYASDLPPGAIKAGGTAFLQKPFDTAKLVDAIRQTGALSKR